MGIRGSGVEVPEIGVKKTIFRHENTEGDFSSVSSR